MATTPPDGDPHRDARPVSRRTLLRGAASAAVGLGLATTVEACSSESGKTAADTSPTAAPSTAAPTKAAPTKATTGTGADAGIGKLDQAVQYPKGYVGPRAYHLNKIGDGKTVFNVVVPEDATVVGDWNKNKYTKWWESVTGVKVHFQTISTANNDMTKANAMLASGDLPDAFMGVPFTRDQVSLYGQQGVFVALDDYLTDAPAYQQMIKDYPDLASLSRATDGKTYMFQSIDDCFHCHVSPARAWVNKNFVDAGGGKIPTTTEEFRSFLRALVDNDASGHGDTVPFAAGVDNPVDRFFMNAFLYNPGEPWLRLADGKVDFVANKPEWRTALQYLRSLHDDGTLSPRAFTMTGEALSKLGNTPGHARIGVARCYYWGSFMDIDYGKNARWEDYVAVPALGGPDGTRYASWDYYSSYGYQTLQITKKCKDPKTLARWADAMYTLEPSVACEFGPLAQKNWKWSKPGAKSLQKTQAVWAGDAYPAPVGISWNQYEVRYKSSDVRLGREYSPNNPTFEQKLYEASNKPYHPYRQPKAFQLPPLIFDEQSAASNADISQSLSNHVNQSLAQFAIGKLDVHDDSVWATYTDKIEQMGLKQYLANYQKAYDQQAS